ncbi:hypothetical protein Trihar35433_10669 [Trichoderma harzianum]|nr:hypothetical protein Trihar35433_10669 [Trichoderma harzianum]
MDSTPNLEFANIQLALTLLFNFYQEFRRYREEARRYQIRQLQYRYALRHLALEITARGRNADRRKYNGLMRSFFGTNVRLAPLADLRTGKDIERFPTTAEEISALDAYGSKHAVRNESRRILEALGLPTEGVPLIVMRALILQLAVAGA